MPHITKHTATLSMGLGGDEPTWEGEATVQFTYYPGFPGRGPDFNSPGEPPEPPEITDICVTHIDGTPVSQREYGKYEAETLETHIECNDRLYEELVSIAEAELADWKADAMERRAEDRRLEP
jgi:hypothetical protein